MTRNTRYTVPNATCTMEAEPLHYLNGGNPSYQFKAEATLWNEGTSFYGGAFHLPSEYPIHDWDSYVVDLDQTTGIRHILCRQLFTDKTESSKVVHLATSDRPSGSMNSFPGNLSGYHDHELPAQSSQHRSISASLQDIDTSVLEFKISMPQLINHLQDLDSANLFSKPSIAHPIEKHQFEVFGSLSILDTLFPNPLVGPSEAMRLAGAQFHQPIEALAPSSSILSQIISDGIVYASAKSGKLITSPRHILLSGQIVPLFEINAEEKRITLQERATGSDANVTPYEAKEFSPSSYQSSVFSPRDLQTGSSTPATSAGLSTKFPSKDLQEAISSLGQDSKVLEALDIAQQGRRQHREEHLIPSLLDVDVSFRQRGKWYDIQNRKEEANAVPRSYIPIAVLSSTSGLESPDQVVLRMTISEILLTRLMLAEQVRKLPYFDVDRKIVSQTCCALDLLPCKSAGHTSGTEARLDLANVSRPQTRFNQVGAQECGAATSEASDTVEVILDEASGECYLRNQPDCPKAGFGPQKRLRNIPLSLIKELISEFTMIWDEGSKEGVPEIDEAEMKNIALSNLTTKYDDIPEYVIDMMDDLDTEIGEVWRHRFPEYDSRKPNRIFELPWFRVQWKYLRIDLEESAFEFPRKLDFSPPRYDPCPEIIGEDNQESRDHEAADTDNDSNNDNESMYQRRVENDHHHLNFMGQWCANKSVTAPAISLFAVVTAARKGPCPDPCSHRAVVTTCAHKHIDAFAFDSDLSSIDPECKGVALRALATGRTAIVHAPWGSWMNDDTYGQDDDLPFPPIGPFEGIGALDADGGAKQYWGLQWPYFMETTDGITGPALPPTPFKIPTLRFPYKGSKLNPDWVKPEEE